MVFIACWFVGLRALEILFGFASMQYACDFHMPICFKFLHRDSNSDFGVCHMLLCLNMTAVSSSVMSCTEINVSLISYVMTASV